MNKNYTKTLKQYSKIEVELNRLHSQKAAIKHKLKIYDKSERRARTRTLIQLGGLFTISPLLDICKIELGDDLQINHQDKSDTLLGILKTLCEHLPEKLNDSDLEHFKNLGNHARISHEINKKNTPQTQKSGGA